jgi:hypothetical protein
MSPKDTAYGRVFFISARAPLAAQSATSGSWITAALPLTVGGLRQGRVITTPVLMRTKKGAVRSNSRA